MSPAATQERASVLQKVFWALSELTGCLLPPLLLQLPRILLARRSRQQKNSRYPTLLEELCGAAALSLAHGATSPSCPRKHASPGQLFKVSIACFTQHLRNEERRRLTKTTPSTGYLRITFAMLCQLGLCLDLYLGCPFS